MYEEKVTRQIIEDTRSKRKQRNKIDNETKKYSSEGKIIMGRDNIIEEAINYFRKLYDEEQSDQLIDNETMQRLKQKEVENEPSSKIIKGKCQKIESKQSLGSRLH